ncbi:MBL fold metallo-hydrolase [Paenibacillus sp. JCM 10914]|uniref:MBL fold metallo-hydrolase n=1 Tax=Paenibacillus sp. JCM 10914 TaxID=1236974 RepID=UPI0003CC95EB|nr:MBL fold metallo-hydrolase [Paenibacillus sp. JCM 10914]GAE07565.1 beta-lactamase domain protein [Paenibacillus sp. JCM 10914]
MNKDQGQEHTPAIDDIKEHQLPQVKITLANPLRWVNSYILRGEDGVTIIDPGPRTDSSEQEWMNALEKLAIRFDDIASIVLTHHHPDHYGLAGWFQERSGCQVWMSARAHQEAELMWGESSSMDADLPDLFRRHGMPEVWLQRLSEHLNSFFPQVTPQPAISIIHDDLPFRMGNRIWLPVQTAGHAPGHLSFYHADSGVLLCGDAVLPQISPNVSLLPGSDSDPLALFLAGLSRLRELDVRVAYPGHRHPFTHFRDRIDALLLHHEERLHDIAGMLQLTGGLNAFEVCLALFGDKLGIHQLRFAMCEALAHLVELVDRGLAELGENDNATLYFSVRQSPVS